MRVKKSKLFLQTESILSNYLESWPSKMQNRNGITFLVDRPGGCVVKRDVLSGISRTKLNLTLEGYSLVRELMKFRCKS